MTFNHIHYIQHFCEMHLGVQGGKEIALAMEVSKTHNNSCVRYNAFGVTGLSHMVFFTAINVLRVTHPSYPSASC